MAQKIDPSIGIDWHGHRDRGLDIVNTLVAIEAGADRVHACGLGIGERSGNTPMEVLLANLNLLGWADRDLTKLPEYCQIISEKCGAAIPFNYPIVGDDAFRTATGVHARRPSSKRLQRTITGSATASTAACLLIWSGVNTH